MPKCDLANVYETGCEHGSNAGLASAVRCCYKGKSKYHQVPAFSVKQSVTTWGDIPGRKWVLRRELAGEQGFT